MTSRAGLLATVADVHARTDQQFTSEERVNVTVLRALATPPEGSKDEAIGGFSCTLAHFTRDELELLRPLAPAPRGAFSIWTM